MRKLNLSLVLLALFLVSSQAQAALKIALIFDKGGKDDKSFNASAYAGALEYKEKMGAEIKYVAASDNNSFEPLIKAFAKKDFDLIVAIGVSQADAVKKVAPEYPQKKFLLIDAEANSPNVMNALFEEHEGSYLAGAAAAMASKTGVIGFVGGMDIPLIRRFQMGYEAGAKKINSKIKVVVNYIGVTGDAWHNPAKGKELALSQISSKADVIYHASGASGAGVFDAAEEKNILVIGVDSNQNWVKPGRVLTSMLKRVDQAVFHVADQVAKGQFKGGSQRFGLKNQGIDLAMDQYNEKIMDAAIKSKVAGLKKDIMTGKISVPDYYKKQK